MPEKDDNNTLRTGMGLGIAMGIALGVALNNPVWILFGVVIGAAMGHWLPSSDEDDDEDRPTLPI